MIRRLDTVTPGSIRLRIITANVNGIRSAARKGFFPWLSRQKADVVCLQEVRARAEQIADRAFWPRRFHCHYLEAERPGYSGVALFSREAPDEVIRWGVVVVDGKELEAGPGHDRQVQRDNMVKEQ